MSLSTKPYKGARDFYPEDERLQKYMFAILRSVIELYGYEEYNAPILEPIELYLAKTGEEIVNEQTYVFEDRGGRKVVIRPEMTPTVSRMVAGKRQELAYPVRWYSIPNLWRYERPQRGRLREHWQLNVDIFGASSIAAEEEIITIVDDVFKAFGAKPDMYDIRLNSRKMMDYILDVYLNLTKDESHKISKLIDRIRKLSRTDFIGAVDNAISPAQRSVGVTERLMDILATKEIIDLPKIIKTQTSAVALDSMIHSLKAANIANVRFDISLMRGFDYYTDIIFEVFDTDVDNNRSMLGGGRYDGLVGMFGVDPVATVGFGWGDVTLANFLEIHNLLPVLKPETDLYVIILGDVLSEAQESIAELRKLGIKLAVDFTGRKIGDLIKVAEKKNIDNILIIGANELKEGRFSLKNLLSGDEYAYTVAEIADKISKKSQ
jgi:histidyl-tRNA synthetase